MLKQQVLYGLKGFFLGLRSNFEKNDILEDLESAYKEMNTTKEMFAGDLTGYDPYFSGPRASLGTIHRACEKNTRGFRGSVVRMVAEVMTARLGDRDEMMDFVEDIYGPVVLKDALDYRKVQMLRYISGISFFLTYARKLILTATHYRTDDIRAMSKFDKDDEAFVLNEENIRAFTIMLDALSYKAKDIRKGLDRAAKVNFNPDTDDLVGMTNDSRSDPLQFGFMPVIGSMVYYVGMALNLYHAKRQELAKEERDMLKVKLMMLRRKMEGADEGELAKLQKQYDYYEDRVNKISGDLEDLEKGV